MIKCPKCKREKDLILEQPDWKISKRFKYVISIQCHCCNCNVDFNVDSELISVTDAYDIEEEKEYPY